jgi:hypothetical protein
LYVFQNSFFEMVKSGVVVLTVRENADVVDADVAVGWMMYADVGCCWSTGGREREKTDVT